MSQPPPEFDLKRLKWIDPSSDEKFVRKGPDRAREDSSEAILENVLRLVDGLFDHLSVFEQYPEATSRGADHTQAATLDLPEVYRNLKLAEQHLWDAFEQCEARRGPFIEEQLSALQRMTVPDPLKLHLGSGGYPIDGWVNIDAGGGDMALNLNWGLPFSPGSARFVYSAHVLEHLRANDQAPVFLREVLQVLTRGGVLRLVVPDAKKLLAAYVGRDRGFFEARQKSYPLDEGFLDDGVATLEYVLLFLGAGPQLLNLNHKFGYDAGSLKKLLLDAGFSSVRECGYQASPHPELRVDDAGFNASVQDGAGGHYSLFMEAVK